MKKYSKLLLLSLISVSNLLSPEGVPVQNNAGLIGSFHGSMSDKLSQLSSNARGAALQRRYANMTILSLTEKSKKLEILDLVHSLEGYNSCFFSPSERKDIRNKAKDILGQTITNSTVNKNVDLDGFASNLEKAKTTFKSDASIIKIFGENAIGRTIKIKGDGKKLSFIFSVNGKEKNKFSVPIAFETFDFAFSEEINGESYCRLRFGDKVGPGKMISKYVLKFKSADLATLLGIAVDELKPGLFHHKESVLRKLVDFLSNKKNNPNNLNQLSEKVVKVSMRAIHGCMFSTDVKDAKNQILTVANAVESLEFETSPLSSNNSSLNVTKSSSKLEFKPFLNDANTDFFIDSSKIKAYLNDVQTLASEDATHDKKMKDIYENDKFSVKEDKTVLAASVKEIDAKVKEEELRHNSETTRLQKELATLLSDGTVNSCLNNLYTDQKTQFEVKRMKASSDEKIKKYKAAHEGKRTFLSKSKVKSGCCMFS